MKSPKPLPPPKPAAVTTANSADVAGDAAAARRRSRDRYDFSQTLLRPGNGQYLPEGMRNTLG